MNGITKYQSELLEKFVKNYIILLNKLNDKLNIKNIDLLNRFNSDFRATIELLEELNIDLENENIDELSDKINSYKNVNETIKQFLPFMTLNLCLQDL